MTLIPAIAKRLMRAALTRATSTHTATGKPKQRDKPRPVSLANPYLQNYGSGPGLSASHARSTEKTEPTPQSGTPQLQTTPPADQLRRDDRRESVKPVEVRSGRTALL